jgi:hypothetical protein
LRVNIIEGDPEEAERWQLAHMRSDGIHTPTMSLHLPVTAQEIAEAAIGAVEAGASIVHLHARDPKTGKPDQTPEAFEPFLKLDLIGGDRVGVLGAVSPRAAAILSTPSRRRSSLVSLRSQQLSPMLLPNAQGPASKQAAVALSGVVCLLDRSLR